MSQSIFFEKFITGPKYETFLKCIRFRSFSFNKVKMFVLVIAFVQIRTEFIKDSLGTIFKLILAIVNQTPTFSL